MEGDIDQTPLRLPRVVRVGLVPGPLKGLNYAALRYLVLNLNTLQHVFEYEFLPKAPDDPLIRTLSSRNLRSRREIEYELPAFAERYKSLLSDAADDYGLIERLPDHLIILSLATLSDGYYIVQNDKNGLIALGNWRRFMAPPSVIEFILFMVVRVSLALEYPMFVESKHLGTKGCLGDFTATLDDARYIVLNGFFCSQCREALERTLSSREVDALEKILGRSWLGGTGEALSPASMCARLGHDLFLTRGVRPTGFEILFETLQKEGMRQIIILIGGVLLAAMIVWLGLRD